MQSPTVYRVILRTFAALICLFETSLTLAADELAVRNHAAEVDRLFAKWDRLDTPGCAVGMVHRGELVYAKGFGTSDLEAGVPITSQTVFELASASKSFTCACIALLMDQGKLQPDDELASFVPEVRKFNPPIRIRHMVQCHTGLWEPFHIMPLLGWENEPLHSPYSEADVLTVLSGQTTLPFEPGAQFHYGSGDYYFLGLVIKRVTSKPLSQFARENLFEPLGMTRTFYEDDPSRVVQGRAVGHYQQDGIWHQWRVNAYLAGGGGLKTCIDDLVRWDRNFDDSRLPKGIYMDEFIREGTLLGNRYVLDADAYRTRMQQNVPNPPMGQYRGLKRIQFTGGVWGMTAAISRFPEQRLTIICLSNNDEISPFAKTKQIADLWLSDVMEPLPTTTSADEPKEFVDLPLGELENKVGAYRLLSEGRIWKLTVRDGDLHLIDPLNKAWRLKPLTAVRFRPIGDTPFYESARFLFRRDGTDEPFSMTLESNEKGFHEVLEFRRVDLVDLSPTELNDYVGEYVNDDVGASYRFSVKDGGLWLRVGSRRWERFEPTVSDEFIPHIRTLHDNRIIRFRRDEDQLVAGVTIAFWRVKGLELKRKP